MKRALVSNKFAIWVRSKSKYYKNKYVVTLFIFSFYGLFLDDVDVFTIISQNIKLNRMETEKEMVEEKLKATKNTLDKLKYPAALEAYAREKKLFKKEDEDIFIITYK
jgi:endo-alpha-1,4-polygalactosaminidase (GH114 family)